MTVLLVANDKGIGARDSFETDYSVTSYNTHQDNGTVSIVAVPNNGQIEEVYGSGFPEQPLGSDLQNIESASVGNPQAAIRSQVPAHIGDPSLIKHVFLIIRENLHLRSGFG